MKIFPQKFFALKVGLGREELQGIDLGVPGDSWKIRDSFFLLKHPIVCSYTPVKSTRILHHLPQTLVRNLTLPHSSLSQLYYSENASSFSFSVDHFFA